MKNKIISLIAVIVTLALMIFVLSRLPEFVAKNFDGLYGGLIMSDLTHLFKIGQKVTYRNNDFDAIKRNIPCIVKETYPDHIIITDTETDTDLWIE